MRAKGSAAARAEEVVCAGQRFGRVGHEVREGALHGDQRARGLLGGDDLVEEGRVHVKEAVEALGGRRARVERRQVHPRRALEGVSLEVVPRPHALLLDRLGRQRLDPRRQHRLRVVDVLDREAVDGLCWVADGGQQARHELCAARERRRDEVVALAGDVRGARVGLELGKVGEATVLVDRVHREPPPPEEEHHLLLGPRVLLEPRRDLAGVRVERERVVEVREHVHAMLVDLHEELVATPDCVGGLNQVAQHDHRARHEAHLEELARRQASAARDAVPEGRRTDGLGDGVVGEVGSRHRVVGAGVAAAAAPAAAARAAALAAPGRRVVVEHRVHNVGGGRPAVAQVDDVRPLAQPDHLAVELADSEVRVALDVGGVAREQPLELKLSLARLLQHRVELAEDGELAERLVHELPHDGLDLSLLARQQHVAVAQEGEHRVV